MTSSPTPPASAQSPSGDKPPAPTRPRKLPGAALDARSMKIQNIALAAAALLVWIAFRFLYIELHLGTQGGFYPFDALLIFLAPIGAFFFNWYWLREQRSDIIIRWSAGWAAGDLALYFLCVYLLAPPLHHWLSQF